MSMARRARQLFCPVSVDVIYREVKGRHLSYELRPHACTMTAVSSLADFSSLVTFNTCISLDTRELSKAWYMN